MPISNRLHISITTDEATNGVDAAIAAVLINDTYDATDK